MNKIQAERLLKLSKRLRKIHGDNFDMNYWADEHPCHPCGTVGCAAGHAGLMPEFIKEGFVTKPSYCGGTVKFEGFTGIDACAQFFGSYSPFSPTHYDSNNIPHEKPDQVADYMEQLVFEAFPELQEGGESHD